MPDELQALAHQVLVQDECRRATGILHAFAASLDEPKIDTVLGLFREDAVLQTPQYTAVGHEKIRKFFERAWAKDPSAKRHFVMTPRVTWLEPGRVRLEAYYLFIGRLPGSSVVGWGTYDDVVDVTGPEPRFARVFMDSHLRTDLETGWALPLAGA